MNQTMHQGTLAWWLSVTSVVANMFSLRLSANTPKLEQQIAQLIESGKQKVSGSDVPSRLSLVLIVVNVGYPIGQVREVVSDTQGRSEGKAAKPDARISSWEPGRRGSECRRARLVHEQQQLPQLQRGRDGCEQQQQSTSGASKPPCSVVGPAVCISLSTRHSTMMWKKLLYFSYHVEGSRETKDGRSLHRESIGLQSASVRSTTSTVHRAPKRGRSDAAPQSSSFTPGGNGDRPHTPHLSLC